jgi:hypothetical protein
MTENSLELPSAREAVKYSVMAFGAFAIISIVLVFAAGVMHAITEDNSSTNKFQYDQNVTKGKVTVSFTENIRRGTAEGIAEQYSNYTDNRVDFWTRRMSDGAYILKMATIYDSKDEVTQDSLRTYSEYPNMFSYTVLDNESVIFEPTTENRETLFSFISDPNPGEAISERTDDSKAYEEEYQEIPSTPPGTEMDYRLYGRENG